MHVKAKVAVIFFGGADLRGCRLALAAAGGAWDAGAEVRVRRVERLAPPPDARSEPQWDEVLREADDVPEARPEDLAWADAVLFGASIGNDAVRTQLAKLIHAILPVWDGVVVPSAPIDPTAPRGDDANGGEPVPVAGAPTATELAAACEEGRQVAEAALAVKSGRSPLADVA